MPIEEKKRVIFPGTPTTDAERKQLQENGFVHVSGLRVFGQKRHQSYLIGEKITEKDHGTYGFNNGIWALITTGGEVWLCSSRKGILSSFLEKMAPNGKGAFVPCSNGEAPLLSDVLARVADPNHGIVVEK